MGDTAVEAYDLVCGFKAAWVNIITGIRGQDVTHQVAHSFSQRLLWQLGKSPPDCIYADLLASHMMT